MADGLSSEDDLGRMNAQEFLRKLARRPFVALVMDEGDQLKVYTKGVTEEELRTIKSVLKTEELEN